MFKVLKKKSNKKLSAAEGESKGYILNSANVDESASLGSQNPKLSFKDESGDGGLSENVCKKEQDKDEKEENEKAVISRQDTDLEKQDAPLYDSDSPISVDENDEEEEGREGDDGGEEKNKKKSHGRRDTKNMFTMRNILRHVSTSKKHTRKPETEEGRGDLCGEDKTRKTTMSCKDLSDFLYAQQNTLMELTNTLRNLSEVVRNLEEQHKTDIAILSSRCTVLEIAQEELKKNQNNATTAQFDMEQQENLTKDHDALLSEPNEQKSVQETIDQSNETFQDMGKAFKELGLKSRVLVEQLKQDQKKPTDSNPYVTSCPRSSCVPLKPHPLAGENSLPTSTLLSPHYVHSTTPITLHQSPTDISHNNTCDTSLQGTKGSDDELSKPKHVTWKIEEQVNHTPIQSVEDGASNHEGFKRDEEANLVSTPNMKNHPVNSDQKNIWSFKKKGDHLKNTTETQMIPKSKGSSCNPKKLEIKPSQPHPCLEKGNRNILHINRSLSFNNTGVVKNHLSKNAGPQHNSSRLRYRKIPSTSYSNTTKKTNGLGSQTNSLSSPYPSMKKNPEHLASFNTQEVLQSHNTASSYVTQKQHHVQVSSMNSCPEDVKSSRSPNTAALHGSLEIPYKTLNIASDSPDKTSKTMNTQEGSTQVGEKKKASRLFLRQLSRCFKNRSPKMTLNPLMEQKNVVNMRNSDLRSSVTSHPVAPKSKIPTTPCQEKLCDPETKNSNEKLERVMVPVHNALNHPKPKPKQNPEALKPFFRRTSLSEENKDTVCGVASEKAIKRHRDIRCNTLVVAADKIHLVPYRAAEKKNTTIQNVKNNDHFENAKETLTKSMTFEKMNESKVTRPKKLTLKKEYEKVHSDSTSRCRTFGTQTDKCRDNQSPTVGQLIDGVVVTIPDFHAVSVAVGDNKRESVDVICLCKKPLYDILMQLSTVENKIFERRMGFKMLEHLLRYIMTLQSSLQKISKREDPLIFNPVFWFETLMKDSKMLYKVTRELHQAKMKMELLQSSLRLRQQSNKHLPSQAEKQGGPESSQPLDKTEDKTKSFRPHDQFELKKQIIIRKPLDIKIPLIKSSYPESSVGILKPKKIVLLNELYKKNLS